MTKVPEKQSDKQVLAFLEKESQWKESYQYLRNLIFDESELEEDINGCIQHIPLMIKML